MSIEEALQALAAPEPDEPLAFHPENVATWQRWNDRRVEALRVAEAARCR